MKKILSVILILFIFGCSAPQFDYSNFQADINYYIDVSNHQDDLFHVEIQTTGLSSENSIYNMPATVPGTYQIMDFGRFVSDFKAFDADGREIEVEKISVNRWEIDDPERTAVIRYKVEDSFDAETGDIPVAPMSGTGINDNFIAMNTFGVLGYFEGLQSLPIELKINYNQDWQLGTSLVKNSNGYFIADNYDQLADSPFLMGDLSIADTTVNDIPVEVYVFSNDTTITASKVLNLGSDVLLSSSEFAGYDAAPFYKFLMVLMDPQMFQSNNFFTAGALEHNLSSLYVMPMAMQALPQLRSTMAHEFLHILTPLNLHSELIHKFNFQNPDPSMHVWLYEGVTEWASDIAQLRSGVMSTRDYLNEVTQKMNINDNFDQDISLVEMSLSSYNENGYSDFLNFYMRGALTAMCLDIEILKLSNGSRGFREVFIQLLKDYGKYKPFPDDEFFDIIVERTYPEVKSFIKNYIAGSEPLPVAEYMGELGFTYIPEKDSEDKRPTFGLGLSFNGEDLVLANVSDQAYEWGFRNNDVLLEIMGEEISLATIQEIINNVYAENIVGDNYTLTVKRGDEVLSIKGILQKRTAKHVFEINEFPTEEQLQLREAWLTNL